MAVARLQPLRRARARLAVPGDKSIGHRALLLGALAGGGEVRGLAGGRDVAATRAAVEALGARVVPAGPDGARIERGAAWRAVAPVDCANAGTTARLLLGILAPRARGEVTLTGDASLSTRPMGRVVRPLRAMGAAIEERGESERLPLVVAGRPLAGRVHRLAVASAQVKSALLLAGLAADGETVVVEAGRSRDHTERLLAALGAPIDVVDDPPGGRTVRVRRASLAPIDLDVPGDFSSAAPFLALAAAVPGGEATIVDVGLNPGRTGFLDVLSAMGADVEAEVVHAEPEPSGTVRVRAAGLGGATIDADLVPRAIDELPLVAVLAAVADGETRLTGAAELRVKESDRIATIAAGLAAMGADVEPAPDGFVVRGPRRLRGAALDAAGDHRIGMALAVAAALADGPSTLEGAEWIDVSYPGFLDDLAACDRAGEAA